ncbi:hypothetical protein ADL21_00125 [Streptomyces albus subsp. albus]|nr:hypothetical protein ADL21_00125 [Streptomyces albus subsp. albus]
MAVFESLKLRSDTGEPYILAVPHAPVTDSRLSSADVGVYMRCRWSMDVCAPYGELNWLIAEIGVPDGETRASVRRLVELGYLDTVGSVEIESITAHEVAERVREAIEATIDDLTPAERAALVRLADLVERRRDRARAALDTQSHGEA